MNVEAVLANLAVVIAKYEADGTAMSNRLAEVTAEVEKAREEASVLRAEVDRQQGQIETLMAGNAAS